jgi:protein-S-isoprenylcysteine O-methyltransferase Ste14
LLGLVLLDYSSRIPTGFRSSCAVAASTDPAGDRIALVTTGPFQFSRNPLYVSLTLLYLGIAIAAQSLWALALLIVVLAVMQRSVVRREEHYLEQKFGADYLRYKERVRRWI